MQSHHLLSSFLLFHVTCLYDNFSRSLFTETKCCGYWAPLQPPPCSEHLVPDLEDKGWVLSWPSSWPRKMRRRSCSASLVGREPGISQQTCSHTCDQVFKSLLIVTCLVGQISTSPGGAHQHGVFPRRSKVDVLLQHQRRTSGCVPAGLQNDNEDFIFGGQIVRQISQTFHLPCNLIPLTFEATSVPPNSF